MQSIKARVFKPFVFLKVQMAYVFVAVLLTSPVSRAETQSASAFYEDALVYYNKEDYNTAVIQLKNALQLSPGLPSAHLLLGLSYLKLGNGELAAEELLNANRLGADRSLTVVPLAQALLTQMKYHDLLATVSAEGFPPELRSEILALRGQAYTEVRDFEAAAASFREAGKLDPKAVSPLVGQGTLLLRRGMVDDAEKIAAEAVSRDATNADGWNLKASISHAKGQHEQAIEEYGRVIDLEPKHYEARLARAGLLFELGKNDHTSEDLNFLRKTQPFEPRANYLYALLMARKGAPEAAKTALNETVTVIDGLDTQVVRGKPTLLLVAGLSNYNLRHFEKAREFLTHYFEQYPGHAEVAEALGSVLVEQRDHNEAIRILSQALKYHPDHFRLLYLLGTAYMHKGQHSDAITALEKASQASGGLAEVKTQLAFSRLGTSQQNIGISELRSILENDPGQRPAAIALGVLYLKRGQPAEAVKILTKSLEREPNNLTLINMLAAAQMASGERDSARKNFEKALSKDASFLPSLINLGKLDLIEGKIEQAENRFLGILRERPQDTQTMIQLAALEDARGRSTEALRWLEKARAADNKAIHIKLKLIYRYLGVRDTQKALAVAQEAETIAPDNLDVLTASARCQLALGKKPVAQVILQKIARSAFNDAERLFKTAGLQIAADAVSDAIWSLESAARANPDYLPVQAALVETYLKSGITEKAIEVVENLHNRHPDLALSDQLTGDIRMHQSQYAEAIVSYRSAFQKNQDSLGAVRLYQAQRLAGKGEEAFRFLEQWVSSHSEDFNSMQALAEGYLQAGKQAEAIGYFERILKRYPDYPPTLNNLAVLYSNANDPRALELAERAHKAAPDNPSVNDTIGWILVRQGKPAEGLPYLRNAHIRSSSDPEIRYHTAVALDALGRRKEALNELNEALRANTMFDEIEDAKKLQAKLQDHR